MLKWLQIRLSPKGAGRHHKAKEDTFERKEAVFCFLMIIKEEMFAGGFASLEAVNFHYRYSLDVELMKMN